MNAGLIKKKFREMGIEAEITEQTSTQPGRRYRPSIARPASSEQSVRIDVRTRKGKPYYKIDYAKGVTLKVLDQMAKDRHLLLLSTNQTEKERYLCGHDERQWFVAAIADPVSTVVKAKEALKPRAVRDAQFSIKKKDRNKRRNKAFIRQGEWFFIPVSTRQINTLFGDEKNHIILKNEPIQRGRGNPHIVEEIIRVGGQEIFVHHNHPEGVNSIEYNKIIAQARENKNFNLTIGWRTGRINARVFGRGRVTHRQHETLVLGNWHEIVPNTEEKAPFMRRMAFID